MQRLINVCALFGAAVSLGFLGTGTYIYFQRDAIQATIEGKVRDAVMGALDFDVPSMPGAPGGGVPTLPGI